MYHTTSFEKSFVLWYGFHFALSVGDCKHSSMATLTSYSNIQMEHMNTRDGENVGISTYFVEKERQNVREFVMSPGYKFRDVERMSFNPTAKEFSVRFSNGIEVSFGIDEKGSSFAYVGAIDPETNKISGDMCYFKHNTDRPKGVDFRVGPARNDYFYGECVYMKSGPCKLDVKVKQGHGDGCLSKKREMPDGFVMKGTCEGDKMIGNVLLGEPGKPEEVWVSDGSSFKLQDAAKLDGSRRPKSDNWAYQ